MALVPLVRASDLDVAETRRRRSVSCSHYLLWLTLATVWSSPENPLIARADCVHGIPELGRDARVRRVLQHSPQLAATYLPADLGPKLKVVTLVVNRPRAIGLHQNSVVGLCNQLRQRQRFFSRQDAHIGHTDHRQPVPAVG